MISINDNAKAFPNWDSAVVRIFAILRELGMNSGGSVFGSTYFVAPEGDDDTGQVGNINSPFKTILAAVNQAVADGLPSPLVYVFPGIYPEDSLQYDGSFFFTPGAVVTGRTGYHGTTGIVAVSVDDGTFTTPGNFEDHFDIPGKKFRVSGGANEGIYTCIGAANDGPNTTIRVEETIPSAVVGGRLNDGMGVFYCGPVSSTYLLYGNAALNCKIYGELTVNRAETIDGDWSGGAFDVGQDAEMFVECHSITMEQGIGVYMQDNAILTLKGEFFDVLKSGYGATVRDTSESVFMFQRIRHLGTGGGFIGNCFFFRQGSTGGFSGTCRIEAEELSTKGTAGNLQLFNVLAGARIFVECPDINSESQWCVVNNNHFGGEVRVQANLTGGLGLYNGGNTNGYFKLTGDIIGTADATQIVQIVNGDVYINGDIYHNGTPIAITQLIDQNNGRLRLNGRVQNDTVGGFGINKDGGTLVLDDVKIISDADSINAAAAQDIKVIHSLACNTALNANVTNIIVGSNVIIDANIE